MALILNIETATDVCSVVLSKDSQIIQIREEIKAKSHATLLTTFILECFQDSGYNINDLDAIAISKGPGSYTGLRIGVATAKGLCYALEKPLISVNTLQSMAAKFLISYPELSDNLVCPLIDARRMEVFTAVFDHKLRFVKATSAEIISGNSFSEILSQNKVIFIGDGMLKSRDILKTQANAGFGEDFYPSASGMVHLSELSYNQGAFEDLAYFEPYYLKDFFDTRQPPKG